MKTALVLGGGGFIGGHLAKHLKKEGFWVRIVDIKPENEFWNTEDICNEYICGDLCDINIVSKVLFSPNQSDEKDTKNAFDEVYQLAADMGGAGYIFTGKNDANIMHGSALINLHVADEATKKSVKRIFYSSSACIYPGHNQLDPNNPNCEGSSAYPANPVPEYGWEKLFSERLYLSYNRNYKLDVRIGRFHNIFGPMSTWQGGKEKSPAAMCRKVVEVEENGEIEVWGDGTQTRSFLYIDNCIEAVTRFMRQNSFLGPVNIGSEEMITINQLAQMCIDISKKNVSIKTLSGQDFFDKYGFHCPIGVKGRNSDNKLFKKIMQWEPTNPLIIGLEKTYHWIDKMVKLRDQVNV